MSRVVKNFASLTKFHNQRIDSCPANLLISRDDRIDIFAQRNCYESAIISQPLLVPSVLEGLRNSEFKSRIHLVPGEADTFCAAHLAECQHGGIVLTSDSDLLVHEMGDGRVAFFRDMETNHDNDWMASIYNVEEICRRNELPKHVGARRLCYEIYCDPHKSFQRAVADCTFPVQFPDEYEQFCKQYLLQKTSYTPITIYEHEMTLDNLDPRVSELVLQFARFIPNTVTPENVNVFLPSLIENPLRGSAWASSAPIRELAYFVLQSFINGKVVIREHRRPQMVEQKGIAAQNFNITDASTLARDIRKHMKKIKELATSHQWMMLCLKLDVDECQARGKPCIALKTLQQPHTEIPRQLSWDLIHFAAQLQASFYSFRIIHQIFTTLPEPIFKTLPEVVLHLHNELATFPPLAEFPEILDILNFLRDVEELKVMELLELPKLEPTVVGESKKRKKKDKGLETTSKRPLKKPAGNRFSLLADDE